MLLIGEALNIALIVQNQLLESALEVEGLAGQQQSTITLIAVEHCTEIVMQVYQTHPYTKEKLATRD